MSIYWFNDKDLKSSLYVFLAEKEKDAWQFLAESTGKTIDEARERYELKARNQISQRQTGLVAIIKTDSYFSRFSSFNQPIRPAKKIT